VFWRDQSGALLVCRLLPFTRFSAVALYSLLCCCLLVVLFSSLHVSLLMFSACLPDCSLLSMGAVGCRGSTFISCAVFFCSSSACLLKHSPELPKHGRVRVCAGGSVQGAGMSMVGLQVIAGPVDYELYRHHEHVLFYYVSTILFFSFQYCFNSVVQLSLSSNCIFFQ